MDASIHRHLAAALCLLTCALAGGCMGGARAGFALQPQPQTDKREVLRESLFRGDQRLIADDELGRVLDATITIPRQARVAVHNIDDWYYRALPGWRGKHMEAIASQLTDNAAVPIPALLMPERVTIAELRVAAARLQCELMLLYTVDFHLRRKNRVWRRDDVAYFGSVTGMLFHVRSGVFPFTATIDVTGTYDGREHGRVERDEVDDARMRATREALGEIGRRLDQFLRSGGALPPQATEQEASG